MRSPARALRGGLYDERMSATGAPHPTQWLRVDLLPSAGDRTRDLADLLTELAIPAVVRHSMLDGKGTCAFVTADDESSALSVDDGFQPTLRFARVDASALHDRLASLDAASQAPAAEHARLDGIA